MSKRKKCLVRQVEWIEGKSAHGHLIFTFRGPARWARVLVSPDGVITRYGVVPGSPAQMLNKHLAAGLPFEGDLVWMGKVELRTPQTDIEALLRHALSYARRRM